MVYFLNATDLDTPCNYAILINQCTYRTCCVAQGYLTYLPSLPGNAFLIACFVILFWVHLVLGIRYRTWSFMMWMLYGVTGEIMGYAGRVWLYFDAFEISAALLYLVPLTAAPSCITAGIYLCFPRIIRIYDPDNSISRFRPEVCIKTFVSFSFMSLVVQAAGSGMIASANGVQKIESIGQRVVTSGLALQVFSIFAFMVLCADFGFRLHKVGDAHRSLPAVRVSSSSGTAPKKLADSNYFKSFLLALGVSSTLIQIRCIFRLAVFQYGVKSAGSANGQILFMVLDGGLMVLSIASLSFGHPGMVLGVGGWNVQNSHNTGAGELGMVVQEMDEETNADHENDTCTASTTIKL